MVYSITFDKKKCIGSGACVSVCPQNWELIEREGEFKAKPKNSRITEDEFISNQDAADICPVDAITIEKDKSRSGSIPDEDVEDFY